MPRRPSRHPDWDRLYEQAAAQQGLFTTAQAALAGYSPQLLIHHINGGRIVRARRGVYRLVHYPAGEHEDLVTVWLWSEQQGVISHQSALSLHELSDALPSRIHLTLPLSWQLRRLRVPSGVTLHFGDLEPSERTWRGDLPTTSVTRTLMDCVAGSLSPELIGQATAQALARGLIGKAEQRRIERAIAAAQGTGE